MVERNFQIYGAQFLRKWIESRDLLPMLLSPTYHTPQAEENYSFPGSIFSKICFSLQQKGVEETMICFFKIETKIMKIIWNIRLFVIFLICIFFKCDDLTVLQIIYLSYSKVLILLSLLCNQNNLLLELHQKKISIFMEGGFL